VFLFSLGSANVARLRSHALVFLAVPLFAFGCDAQDRATPPAASAKEVAIPGAPILIAAGDIAICGTNGAEMTGALVDSLIRVDSAANVETAVVTMGDNAYPSGNLGSRATFVRCFGPSWGKDRIMHVIHPAPGNHDFETTNGPSYYGYFGNKAGPTGLGYYSYDIGKWHVVSLNSEILVGREFFPQARAQEAWLRNDLKEHGKKCTLAYWHRPLFSSGTHGGTAEALGLWKILYDNGVELVLNGHEHDYERFVPQTPAGVVDSVKGIEEIIAGTGGADLRGLRYPVQPGSALQINGYWGVLKLTLGDDEYRHAFIDTSGRVWDEGGRKCH
jgi:hypothetical protein